MGLFGSRRVLGIAEETLEFALDASEGSHPNEFMGVLRGERADRVGVEGDGYVVTDVLVIPATKSSPVSATLKTNLVPNDANVLGSVHSHPNGVLRPSDADLATFGRGTVHVIVGAPYGREDWRAFDREGETRELDVVDADLADPESFFDFTQADIDEDLRR